MSSSDKPELEPSTTDGKSAARDIPTQPQDNVPASTPVEMNSLPSDHTIGVPAEQQTTNKSLESAQMPHLPMRTDTSTAILASQQTSASSVPPMPSASSPRSNRAYSTAIGESSDSPLPPVKDTETTGPTLMITLLLINGARHPFNLDAKYLSKRNVQTQANDPFSLSVYKVKELILREWREEWELKPSSPSAIRLIHFGKVLDDKTAIKGRLYIYGTGLKRYTDQVSQISNSTQLRRT